MNRTRSQGGFDPRTVRRYVTVGGMNPPAYPSLPPYADTTATTRADYVITNDVVTPGYRRLIAAGKIINNPFYRFSVTSYPSNDSVNAQQVPGSPVSYGGVSGYQFVAVSASGDLVPQLLGALPVSSSSSVFASYPIPGEATARANAVNKMLSGISAPSAQSLVTAFEAKKTVKEMLERVDKLAQYINAARKGRRDLLNTLLGSTKRAPIPKRYIIWDPNGTPVVQRSGKVERKYGYAWVTRKTQRPLDEPTKLWLEARYGWGPLVHDIIDTMKALYAEDLRQELIPRTRYVSRREETSENSSSSVNSLANYLRGNWTWRSYSDHKVTIRAYALYEHLYPTGMLRRMRDFGVFEIPQAIWELTPWSFVADWICPVGDYLSALTPKVGVVVLAAGVKTHRELTVGREVLTYSPIGAGTSDYWPAPWPCNPGAGDSVVYSETNRDPSLPSPVFPPIDVQMTSKRIADAFALLRQAGRR